MKMESNELKLLHSGQLATLRAVLHALIRAQTPENREIISQSFEQTAAGLKFFIEDWKLATAEQPSKEEQSQTFEYLEQDIAFWLKAMGRTQPLSVW